MPADLDLLRSILRSTIIVLWSSRLSCECVASTISPSNNQWRLGLGYPSNRMMYQPPGSSRAAGRSAKHGACSSVACRRTISSRLHSFEVWSDQNVHPRLGPRSSAKTQRSKFQRSKAHAPVYCLILVSAPLTRQCRRRTRALRRTRNHVSRVRAWTLDGLDGTGRWVWLRSALVVGSRIGSADEY